MYQYSVQRKIAPILRTHHVTLLSKPIPQSHGVAWGCSKKPMLIVPLRILSLNRVQYLVCYNLSYLNTVKRHTCVHTYIHITYIHKYIHIPMREFSTSEKLLTFNKFIQYNCLTYPSYPRPILISYNFKNEIGTYLLISEIEANIQLYYSTNSIIVLTHT